MFGTASYKDVDCRAGIDCLNEAHKPKVEKYDSAAFELEVPNGPCERAADDEGYDESLKKFFKVLAIVIAVPFVLYLLYQLAFFMLCVCCIIGWGFSMFSGSSDDYWYYY